MLMQTLYRDQETTQEMVSLFRSRPPMTNNYSLSCETMDSTKELFKLYDLIQCGDVSTVESFLRKTQIDLNEILLCKGIGVLHLAVGIDPIEKSRKCTELLLKHGAVPNLCNEDGVTPVHIAAIWGRLDNIKLLIGCGGDPLRCDLDGLTAFDYAAREQQWDVFDYFHNVVDEKEDSFESTRAYSLDLERILVTTDQIVAEYEPLNENQTNSTIRKSEMVRQWCDKHSFVMNKLYPTIVSDTFTIENNPDWRSINITKNITLDLTEDLNKTVNETHNNSYKTCQTTVETPTPIEISGIHRLDITSDEDKSEKNVKQRFSIYENFSLPGSPNSIIHRNYNTKSSLKKKCLADNSKSMFTEDCSDDCSQDFDKAVIVVQNKTNEWLSASSKSDCKVTDIGVCNTRRSSASSGVSSNLSGGSIVIANVEEQYKYEDKEENVVLIERRLLVSSVILPVEDESPDHTIVSVASSLPPSVEYDNNTLRAELLKLGFKAGPIQNSTRTLYLKKLQALKKNPILATINNKGKTYSVVLEKSLRSDEWTKHLDPYIELENKARNDFANPKKKWREGNTKASFTYLLLDPRLTDNLPARASKQSLSETWNTFVNSIFYVGKGKRTRPYSHLYQALTLWKRDFTTSQDQKVQKILDIWSNNFGVICLHVFLNVIPAEAYTYEASMIDVIGVNNLTNQKVGNYYGVVESWPLKERRMLGLYLLFKAMQIFLTEGERQLSPDDID